MGLLTDFRKAIKESELFSSTRFAKARRAADEIRDGDVMYSMNLADRELLQKAEDVLETLAKGSRNIVSYYDMEDVYIANQHAVDVTDSDTIRRAIHTVSNFYNTLGVYRDDFTRADNDKWSRNAYYAMCEKTMMDYMGSATYQVMDKHGDRVEDAEEFFAAPNPQDGWGELIKPCMRDLTRYDAGVWVKSFKRSGYISELKSYYGTEFWKEIDRVALIVNVPVMGNVIRGSYAKHMEPTYQGYWSHGYVERYWQRSRTGVYIPFKPEEICYFMMYPRTDGIYGVDYLKYLKYQLQYLIDSTRAAGKTFENGVVPSLVWEHPEIRNEKQLLQRIREVQKGNQGSNRFGTMLHTVAGEKVSTLAGTLHEMEWLEGQKFVAQLVWAMWGFSPTEFVGESENRATAYVKRNITKSKMLYPLMKYFEDKINREVLPYMKYYRKGWRFQFIRDIDLDDEQKVANTASIKAVTTNTYVSMGLPFSVAAKLAGLGDDVKTLDIESLDQMVANMGMAGTGELDEMTGGADGEDGNPDKGRYDGSGTYVETNFSDGNQGNEEAEQRFGEDEEKQFKKAGDTSFRLVEGRDGQERWLPYETYVDAQAITKAKVYIAHPSEAPRGRTVHRGARHGFYYITTERQRGGTKNESGSGEPQQQHKKKHSGWKAPAEQEGDGGELEEAPEPPEIKGGKKTVKITGKGVGVVIALLATGAVKGQVLQNSATRAFVRSMMQGCHGKKEMAFLTCAARFAEKAGLDVESNV